MKRTIWLTAICGAIMLIGWISSLSRANPPAPRPYPRPCPNVCYPNVQNWGYNETKWRKWPGEERPEQINPKRPVSEVLTTPQGQEMIPPPRAVSPQSAQPKAGSYLPEGTITSPGGLLIPGDSPSWDTEPLTGKKLPDLPPLDSSPKKDEAKPEVKPESQPEPKTPEKSSGTFEPERRYYPPRRTVSATPISPERQADRLAPVTGGMEPERSSRYDSARRDGGLTPVGGIMEPERSNRMPSAYRADPISSTMPERTAREVEPAAYAIAESAGIAEVGDQFVVPPVALAGYCPVELAANGHWTPGDLRWTVVHNGLIYRLSGNQQRQAFLANPDRYAPVESGNDCVLLVDQRRQAAGSPNFCAIYQGRLFMFSSAESQARFNSNPERYTAGR